MGITLITKCSHEERKELSQAFGLIKYHSIITIITIRRVRIFHVKNHRDYHPASDVKLKVTVCCAQNQQTESRHHHVDQRGYGEAESDNGSPIWQICCFHPSGRTHLMHTHVIYFWKWCRVCNKSRLCIMVWVAGMERVWETFDFDG